MKCIRELKELINHISSKGRLERSDVNNVFVKIRQIMENEKKFQNEFPIVNLYCNWVVHTKLKDSKTIYRFLVSISKNVSSSFNIINADDAKDATNHFILSAGNIVQIPALRQGIKSIFRDKKIDCFLVNKKECWDAFITLLLQEISDKPLEFPESLVNEGKPHKRASKFFEELKSLPHNYDWDKIIRLHIFDENEKYYINLESIGRAHYVVELLGREAPEAFAS
jgi:hypothetical protein